MRSSHFVLWSRTSQLHYMIDMTLAAESWPLFSLHNTTKIMFVHLIWLGAQRFLSSCQALSNPCTSFPSSRRPTSVCEQMHQARFLKPTTLKKHIHTKPKNLSFLPCDPLWAECWKLFFPLLVEPTFLSSPAGIVLAAALPASNNTRLASSLPNTGESHTPGKKKSIQSSHRLIN